MKPVLNVCTGKLCSEVVSFSGLKYGAGRVCRLLEIVYPFVLEGSISTSYAYKINSIRSMTDKL